MVEWTAEVLVESSATQPLLWQRTAFRGEGELVPARAKALHIEVLPEIEVPAPSHGMVKGVPGLRDPGDNGDEVSVQG